jgi:TRAP-type C4-dicarboxylate transport system permease small subunit
MATLLYRTMLAGAMAAMVAAFGCVVLGVLSRQLGFAVSGLDAYAGYAIAAALFLALPETLRRDQHIRVTMLAERLPPRGRAALQAVVLAGAAVLAGVLAWFSWRLVWFSHLTGDVSTAADATPLWLPQLSMAIGTSALALAFVQALLSQARGRGFFDAAAAAAE